MSDNFKLSPAKNQRGRSGASRDMNDRVFNKLGTFKRLARPWAAVSESGAVLARAKTREDLADYYRHGECEFKELGDA